MIQVGEGESETYAQPSENSWNGDYIDRSNGDDFV